MTEELFKDFGKFAFLIIVASLLARSIWLHWLTRNVEGFKAQLSAHNEKEIAALRSQLSMQTLEHEVKYRGVYEKLAEHLAQNYVRLFKVYTLVDGLVKDVYVGEALPKIDQLNNVIEANKQFWQYFLENRLYVPPDLYSDTHALGDKLAKIANEYRKDLERAEKKRPERAADDESPTPDEMFEHDATPMFKALVDKVQKRLGVIDSAPAPAPAPA